MTFIPTAYDNGAEGFVSNGILLNQGLQHQAFTELSSKISDINAMLGTLGQAPTVSVQLGTLSSTVDPFINPVLPTTLSVTPSFPTAGVLLDVIPNFKTETGYFSNLLTELSGKLSDLILNKYQTGLDPVIEQQLWDRARERTAATSQGLIDNIGRQYQRSGWDMPTGDEIAKVLEAREHQVIQDITESRSIAVAQADLEQKNFQFSVTQAIALESKLMELYNALEQRMLEEEKTRIESLNEINKIGTEVYKARNEAESVRVNAILQFNKIGAELYETQSNAQKARIDAQVAVRNSDLAYLSKVADINIEDIKANVATFLANKELALGVLKTLAQVYSQLVASFGSAVNYSAGVSSSKSNSASNSYSASDSVSTSTSTNYSG